jgi:hypothetical protein
MSETTRNDKTIASPSDGRATPGTALVGELVARAGVSTTLAAQPPKTLEGIARAYNASIAAGGPRSQIAIYRAPKYLVWSLEALSTQMRFGKDTAAECALAFGLSRLVAFPGIAEILKKRSEVVLDGDPEAMSFFEHFGVIDPETAGAGALEKPYKRHLSADLAERLGRLATDLGLSVSQLATLALMAAFVDAGSFVRGPAYPAAMELTLRRFGERLQRRAEVARAFSSTAPSPRTALRSFQEILGQVSGTDQRGEGRD